MPSRDAALEIRTLAQDAVPIRVRASGPWTFRGMKEHHTEIVRTLAELQKQAPERIAWDLTDVGEIDDAGAVRLMHALRGARDVKVAPAHRDLLEQVARGLAVPQERERVDPLAGVVRVGEAAQDAGIHLRDGVTLLGQLALDASALARRPAELPLREFSAGIYRFGVTALPVTMLVGFLVGIVLTYLSALQLKRYGADLLVINIVGIGVLRELGPMLASIISAGRSGSALTAQLGVMRVTEEVEALSVMGISVTSRLVLPRVLALAVALPLVAFCTDMAALAGAMLISKYTLGIMPGAFLQALPEAVKVVNFWIGIGKSSAFGFAVAFIACHYGLRVLPNTDSLALGVTRSVVASITAVIILDAIFAILLKDIG
ncbi:MAG TPA: ABC transporter permease [Burkholderiales bacterium]|jgi:phospholipid/cholesterol/gamma-HCH transport system permease protein|nr:ABC transporter permease [Burkholderiales bacterium]